MGRRTKGQALGILYLGSNTPVAEEASDFLRTLQLGIITIYMRLEITEAVSICPYYVNDVIYMSFKSQSSAIIAQVLSLNE